MFSCAVGREEHCKQISLACAGSAHSVSATLVLPLLMACVLSQFQAPGCYAGELSKVGPGLHALLRSKLLRFRFLGTPQSHRLSWACIVCSSQVRAAQATSCMVSTLSSGVVCLITSAVPAAQVSRCAHLQCAMCLFWGADLWLQPSQRIIQNLRKYWLETGSLFTVW